ncbi:hypothetical protein KI387_014014 [Taxus chinensis]|uniref:Pectinesterase catalytic domain-containing protein n=1 Tax=Taxus chinensis TaxID=29808 RepID=A0AA38CMK1_TAXCH|nr:hypothetical protein KI387_014014 [Taxus chinensis]
MSSKVAVLTVLIFVSFSQIQGNNKLGIAHKISVHGNRRLLDDGDNVYFVEKGFPSWLTRADKRMFLGKSGIQADAIVAQDGSGMFKKISDAIDAVPENNPQRYVIYVKRGTYTELVRVPASKTNIMLVGDGTEDTVITGHRSVADGYEMVDTATVAVYANGFFARDMRIENTAGPQKQQAVALLLSSDMAVVYHCKLMGFQDTLWMPSERQFFRECDIYGTIDFICGNAAVVFQNCNIVVRKPLNGQQNIITSSSRQSPDDTSAIVIQDCKVIAAPELVAASGSVSTYLGRPWGGYSRTIFMKSYLGDFIHPDGWFGWPGHGTGFSVYYGEYDNTGPGAQTSNRAKWPGIHMMDASEAQQFTVSEFLHANDWLPLTGVPFQANLD